MILLLPLLLQTADPVSTAAPAPIASPPSSVAQQPDIVVTGKSLQQTERDLAACIARHCPPLEDIVASVAHAENQVVAGAYDKARETLLAARSRDARYADRYPIEVAGLLRANARVANLNGMPDTSRINTIDTLDALKAGLPEGDQRVLAQRLEIGDQFARQGRFHEAADIYRHVANEAEKRAMPTVRGLAMVRSAILWNSLAAIDPQYRSFADGAVAKIARSSDPGLQPFRDAVPAIQARFAKGPDAAAALAKISPGARDTSPTLVFSPAIDIQDLSGGDTIAKFGGSPTTQWVDIAFRVLPDGSVGEVQLLDHSQKFDDGWAKVAMKALARRRYTPYPTDATPPGTDRTERYSLIYDLTQNVLGYHMIGRASLPRLDILDMTTQTAPANAS